MVEILSYTLGVSSTDVFVEDNEYSLRPVIFLNELPEVVPVYRPRFCLGPVQTRKVLSGKYGFCFFEVKGIKDR